MAGRRCVSKSLDNKALRPRAAESGSSISQIVNAALQQALLDDAADLDSFLLHQQEKGVSLWVAARPLSHRLSR
jgi:hypothetical protein